MSTPPQKASPFLLLRPLLLLTYSISFLPRTIIELLKAGNFTAFFSLSIFESHHFATFWRWFGPRVRQDAETDVLPLLRSAASGVCLDIGPGSGQWLYMFAKASNPSITKIYGVEPNPGMHAELKQNAVQHGLEGVYEVLSCEAEELGEKGNLEKESIDTIITVQCLCSIPDPEHVIRSLYPYLKPGGKWIVYEHVKTPFQRGYFVGYWQSELSLIGNRGRLCLLSDCVFVKGFINIFWPHLFGGCDLTRSTEDWILRAGEWSSVDLHLGEDEGPYSTIPTSFGSLIKA
jgi:SAM-dependent methyltransferase